jgi:hypothetical protein
VNKLHDAYCNSRILLLFSCCVTQLSNFALLNWKEQCSDYGVLYCTVHQNTLNLVNQRKRILAWCVRVDVGWKDRPDNLVRHCPAISIVKL